ncbi:hypothetical protein QYE76_031374 [Lolium multiflorum]|uniref:Helitron helicase-like domain-containing protein n=1 Tax=Lolium multiflorum TaxID=4521 RepID=A0AAD8VJP2_LOLMU|nr:hypothetical protein QYE76_031374 [Lolium multiflorum]
MENYSLLMSSSGDEDGGGDGGGADGEAFRGTSPSGGAEQRLLSPDLGFAMAAARKVSTGCSFGGIFFGCSFGWRGRLGRLVDLLRVFVRLARLARPAGFPQGSGVKVDDSINTGRGPYVFRINGLPSHRIGSLVPAPNKSPKFAQLYIYDTDNEIDYRMAVFDGEGGSGVQGGSGAAPDRDIVVSLTSMLDSCNALVRQFRMIRVSRERVELAGAPFRLRIVGSSSDDPRVYIPPTAPELAALIVGDLDADRCKFDIVVELEDGRLKQISPLHPALMSLQYPLLFPYGDKGFYLGISYMGPEDASAGAGQKLVYWNTMLTDVVIGRDKLRSETYQGITDVVGQGSASGRSVGVKVVLSSGFVGSKRYMAQNYQDEMAICRSYGAPDLFVTFTCNPKWDEVADALRFEPGQKPADRPDIVSRVFKMKLDQLYGEVKNGTTFGKTRAVLYTVEFQKRGLPHAHILVWLDRWVCLMLTYWFGWIVSSGLMRLLERLQHSLSMAVVKDGHVLDNRWVVPHNVALLKRVLRTFNGTWVLPIVPFVRLAELEGCLVMILGGHK